METASIEWISGAIRVHPTGGSYRDKSDYEWSATLKVIDHETVELLGVDRPLSKSQMIAVAKVLVDHGFKRIYRQRPGDGKDRYIDISRVLDR